MTPAILSRLGHVHLTTPDLAKSYWFFHDVVGLKEVARNGDSIMFKAWGDVGHHTLALREVSGAACVERVGWRAAAPEVLDQLRSGLEPDVVVEDVDSGTAPGIGAAIRFRAIDRFNFEVFYDVRNEDPSGNGARPSLVKTNAYASHGLGISPRRLDHINLTTTDHVQSIRWMTEKLGFGIREYLHHNNVMEAAWLGVTALPHDMGLGVDPFGKRAGFHHVAFSVDSGSDILRAAEILAEHGVPIERGPGRHAVSQAMFLYMRDPGSGHRVEIYTGGYLILDPDWEPVPWSREEYRQWWGPDLDRLDAQHFTETTDASGPLPALSSSTPSLT